MKKSSTSGAMAFTVLMAPCMTPAAGKALARDWVSLGSVSSGNNPAPPLDPSEVWVGVERLPAALELERDARDVAARDELTVVVDDGGRAEEDRAQEEDTVAAAEDDPGADTGALADDPAAEDAAEVARPTAPSEVPAGVEEPGGPEKTEPAPLESQADALEETPWAKDALDRLVAR